MKLKLTDIKIISEGQQAREAVIARYGSIEKFVEENKLNMYVESVKNYMRRKTITSDTFKYNLTIALNKSYDEIVLSEERQILKHVEDVSNNIKEYKEDKDIEVLEKLRDMCIEKKMLVAMAKMYRAVGMYNFYRNDISVAIEQLIIATTMLENRNEDNLTTSYKSELGLAYIYNEKYEKARKIFEEIEMQLPKLSNLDSKTTFLCYYRMGILYNDIHKHELARQMFEKAVEKAPTKYDEGKATTNIGLTYKNQKKYSVALNYFSKALGMYDADDISSRNQIFNNMAEVYKLKKDYDTAFYYINKVFDEIDTSNMQDYFIFFQTYTQIKALTGETDIALNKLVNLLSRVEEFFTYKKFVIKGIETIIKYGEQDKKLMKELEDVIVNLIKKTPPENEEYKNELITCLGSVSLYLRNDEE